MDMGFLKIWDASSYLQGDGLVDHVGPLILYWASKLFPAREWSRNHRAYHEIGLGVLLQQFDSCELLLSKS